MNKEDLFKALDYVNHSRDKRQEMSSLILSNPELIKPLLSIAFTVDNPISSKACWVLEFTAKEKLEYIFPYLDTFTANLHKVHLDPSVRPMAKICEYLTKNYFQKKEPKCIKNLTNKHLEIIASNCFDWLIGEHKVAAQAYSMTSLLLLGRKYDWIYPELCMVLEQNYANGSAAYKARARMTLEKIK
ncbi:adenylosuccinate lyase [uncultured Maribacter sp.]|uniref:adenylosuccinate lyase n=1 Tax=uncultured Maribacter sp. TaxID=431308 RepID=UPI00262A7D56|nr:adenylosuccinate lyase [uncultured Maribacter sp.]